MKKVFTVLMLVLLMTGMVFANGSSEATGSSGVIKLKLAENQSANNPVSQAMLKFADLVKEKTGGSVEVGIP